MAERLVRRAGGVPPHPVGERRPGARRRCRAGRRVGLRTSCAGRAASAEVVDWNGPAARDRRDSRLARQRRRADRPLLRPLRRAAGRRRSSSGRATRSSRRSATATSTAAAPSTTRASCTCSSPPRASSRAAGELPVNVRFCCDGEEETGGHSIVEFLEADERGADAAVIFDTDMIRARPAGVQPRDARARLLPRHASRRATRDLHSGIYGGAALNAAHALAQAISGVVARDGRLPEPLRRGHRPADRGGAARLGGAAAGPGELAAQGARPLDPRAAEEFYLPHVRRALARRERLRQRLAAPAEDGAAGGGGREPLDPARARARTWTRSRPRSSGSCARRRPRARSSTIERWSSSPPGLVRPDATAIQLGPGGVRARRSASGRR